MNHTDRASSVSVYSPNNLGCHVLAGEQINRFKGSAKINWFEFYQETKWKSVNALKVLVYVCLWALHRFIFLHCREFVYMMFTMRLFQMSVWICAAALWHVNRGLRFLIHGHVWHETGTLDESRNILSTSKKWLCNCPPNVDLVIFLRRQLFNNSSSKNYFPHLNERKCCLIISQAWHVYIFFSFLSLHLFALGNEYLCL